MTHAAITENQRFSEMLAYIKARQEQIREPKVKTNSEKICNKPGAERRGDGRISWNDPGVIARCEKALLRHQAEE